MVFHDVHRLDINAVALSDDGKLAFTGSSDKTAVLWQVNSGKKVAQFDHRTRVNHVSLSAQGKLAFSIDSINDRRFWDLATQIEQSELATSLKFLEINDSAFSDNNRLFLSGSPKQKVKLWRVSDGELLGQWQSFHQAGRTRVSVLSVSFVGDNQFAIITSDGMYELFGYQPML